MAGVAFTIGVLLALACGTVTQGCAQCPSSCRGTGDTPVTLQGQQGLGHEGPSGPERCWGGATCDQLVQELLWRMEDLVQHNNLSYPSVLLAMNLVGEDPNSCLYKQLLQEVKEEAVRKAKKDMTSGQVAQHVLALLSSCQDPRHIQALGQTINLIPILKEKMNEEISHNVISLYQKSLDILTLCVVQEHDDRDTAMAVAKELLSPDSDLDVDSRAMAVLALVCTYSPDTDTEHLMQWAIGNVTNDFLDDQEQNEGMIGDISSMGLAMQALETSSPFYAPRHWDRAQAVEVVQNHSEDYQQSMAIAQVLPGLVGKSYLNAGPLTVQYSITNTLRNYFHYSTSVCVPPGSKLLRVLEVARDEKPQIFSFKTKQYSWGPMVVSIHGLAANTTEGTYWQFFSCWSPLQEGVGTYRPKNWEHIQAIFSIQQSQQETLDPTTKQ